MPPAHDWLRELFQAIDQRDVDGFAAFLTDDAQFRFGNADPVLGRPAIRHAVAAFFASIQSIQHRIYDVWWLEDAVICHGTATYTRHDATELSVPFANVFKFDGERVREYLIFADVSAL